MWVSVAHFALFHLFVLAPFWVLTPIVADDELGGASAYATILAAMGAGSILGGLIALRVEPRRPLAVAFAVILLEVPLYLALAGAAPVAVIAAFALVGSVGAELRGDALDDGVADEHPRARALAGQLVRLARLARLPSRRLHPRRSAAEAFGVAEVLVFAALWSLASTLVRALAGTDPGRPPRPREIRP